MKIYKTIFVVLTFMFIGPKAQSKTEAIKIECRGKTYIERNAQSYDSPYKIDYELVNVYALTNSLDSKGQDNWSFDDGNYVFANQDVSYPSQPGSPSSYRSIFVTNDVISIYISSRNDYDKNRKHEGGMNQKYESRREIKISRITGEWTEQSNRKTEWKDGGWLTYDIFTFGKCGKAIQKF